MTTITPAAMGIAYFRARACMAAARRAKHENRPDAVRFWVVRARMAVREMRDGAPYFFTAAR